MRSTLVFVSLIALLSVPGMAATPKLDAPSPARRLRVPQDVPPKARQVLKARMGQHATSTQNLLRAVVLLDRPTIQVLADRLAGENSFANSAATADLGIPMQVFSEGEKFVAAARELAFAAGTTRTNDAVLADRFAVLVRTCVSCHSDYLHGARPHHPIGMEPSEGRSDREDGILTPAR